MTRRLLLLLALCSDCLPRSGATVALSQPRVQCRASRYPVAVDCSWMLPPTPTATSFIATYRLGVASRGESRPCLQPIPEATHCSIPDILLFSTVPYVLNVTAVHPTGARSTLVAFMAEHIIKPDPPESVCFSPLPGRQLRVQWEPPQSWPFPELFSLKYWIRYRRHGARHLRQVGPIEATVFVLRSAPPQARYYIQVAAQDLTDFGKPSDWSLPAVTCLALGK
ncbi:interleukin-27 subunit beta [Fukomys damarensis]|uniref:Interleukin-27 subunit beta n=1 Tax=Fukomys damarensis TaxID=885580 RepID=A0A091DCN9_FUKDA|nr:interleukin-27 subunit beta [Fukomys damarensis]KFO28837.1 Interleukin-27 subunit beta [Fukomys damarensis]